MTYNFDPDRWYDMQREALEARLASGDLDADRFREALADLEKKYEEMLDRLDGTYRMPD